MATKNYTLLKEVLTSGWFKRTCSKKICWTPPPKKNKHCSCAARLHCVRFAGRQSRDEKKTLSADSLKVWLISPLLKGNISSQSEPSKMPYPARSALHFIEWGMGVGGARRVRDDEDGVNLHVNVGERCRNEDTNGHWWRRGLADSRV